VLHAFGRDLHPIASTVGIVGDVKRLVQIANEMQGELLGNDLLLYVDALVFEIRWQSGLPMTDAAAGPEGAVAITTRDARHRSLHDARGERSI
jgi:hypothetical protein